MAGTMEYGSMKRAIDEHLGRRKQSGQKDAVCRQHTSSVATVMSHPLPATRHHRQH